MRQNKLKDIVNFVIHNFINQNYNLLIMLSEEEASEIKQQLIQQIETNFPEDKKAEAISQIQNMTNEQLEEFLEKNNLVKNSGDNKEKCIFCSIISGNANSYKIDENKSAIAVLEINPLSNGHILIIPKEHDSNNKFLEEAKELAEKVSKKLKAKLKPKQIKIESASLFGHKILNVIPLYENKAPSKRESASPEQLEKLKEKLETKIKLKKQTIKKPKPEKIKQTEKLWLPKRIP